MCNFKDPPLPTSLYLSGMPHVFATGHDQWFVWPGWEHQMKEELIHVDEHDPA